jgi:alkylated DNA repair dioxygenase AlkB
MKLFETSDPTVNLLPRDGKVYYHGPLMDRPQADNYLSALKQKIEWRHDEGVMFGKKYVTSRQVAWYGEKPFAYNYSKDTKLALPWTDELLELKRLIENKTGETFNSCLLNLYHDGSEGMGWHSDNEKELKENGAIASMSFGAERKFVFKHKASKEKVEVLLEHGSLLIMGGTTQEHWLHRLPPSKRITTPRVNLTFRSIAE